MTTDNSPPLYRPCVGIALFNSDGDVFVGERIDTPGAWQMPQGGIDQGEDIQTAAFRELKEETGVSADNAEIIRIASSTFKYDLPTDFTKYGLKNRTLWNGKYKGQEQTWVAMRFKGNDSDIVLDAHTEQEFSRWRWITLADTLEVIVPFKRDVYSKIIAEFSDIYGI